MIKNKTIQMLAIILAAILIAPSIIFFKYLPLWLFVVMVTTGFLLIIWSAISLHKDYGFIMWYDELKNNYPNLSEDYFKTTTTINYYKERYFNTGYTVQQVVRENHEAIETSMRKSKNISL